MRGRLAVAVVLLCAAVSARGQTRGAVDWIFLVDTSKSMLEKGVFGEVKESLKTFIDAATDDDSFTVLTFDRQARVVAPPTAARNRGDLRDVVDALQATGNRTHLGDAIAKGLDRAESFSPDPTRTRAIVLFTDGKEDVRGIANPVPIPSNVQRAIASGASIFFVSMGEHEEQLDQFTTARVIRATDAAAIRQVASEIRTVVQPLPPPPPAAIAKPVVVEKPAPIVEPKQPSLLPWLGLIALLAIAGAIAFFVRKQRNQLEGEIEIVKPRLSSESTHVGLPTFKSSEIALSSIVPLDALAGSDARLFCRHQDGAKKVWIAAASGPLRVNDIEVPTAELYDADTIRIGDATLRFNRVGHERPQEDLP